MNEMKNIAFVQPSLCYGGVEKVLTNLLKAIDPERYHIELFLLEMEDAFLDQVPGNVDVHFIQAYNDDSPAFYSSDKVYDTVIAFQGIFTSCLKTALYAFRAKSYIAWIHGDTCFGDADFNLYRGFDKIICVSQGTKERFSKTVPEYSTKTIVINNLLDNQDIIRKSEEIITDMSGKNFSMVTVARLEEEKGVGMIPQIAALLKKEGYSFSWFVVGDGSMKSQMMDDLISEELCDDVILLGWRNNPYPYIRRADLYVQPSFTEGFCTTTNEAKCLCKPVVTTNVPGMQEQLAKGAGGLIIDSITARSLADGIEYLIDHPECRHEYERYLANHRNDNDEILSILYHCVL